MFLFQVRYSSASYFCQLGGLCYKWTSDSVYCTFAKHVQHRLPHIILLWEHKSFSWVRVRLVESCLSHICKTVRVSLWDWERHLRRSVFMLGLFSVAVCWIHWEQAETQWVFLVLLWMWVFFCDCALDPVRTSPLRVVTPPAAREDAPPLLLPSH